MYYLNIKNCYPNTCLMYVVPPDLETLSIRRGNRGDERIVIDVEQLDYVKKFYDYLIVNQNIEDSVCEVLSIINVYQKNSISNNKMFLENYFDNKKLIKKMY